MSVLVTLAALAAVAVGTGAAVTEPRTEQRSIMVQAAVWLAVIALSLFGLALVQALS